MYKFLIIYSFTRTFNKLIVLQKITSLKSSLSRLSVSVCQGLICSLSGAQVQCRVGSRHPSRLRHSEQERRHQGRQGGHHQHHRLPLLLHSSLIISKITRSKATSHTNLCDQLNHVTQNTEITKISDTRRDFNIVKEAVNNISDFLFSSLIISHTNLCDHDIKVQNTEQIDTTSVDPE